MILKKRIGELRKDRKGGIEGLPLQLMIIILVATIGTGIIIGWMGAIEEPRYIGSVDSDPSMISYSGDGLDICITVTDQDGNPLEGAAVSLSGCGIRNADGSNAITETDRDGKAVFTGLTINKVTAVKQITVDAIKPDHGSKTTQILVMP